MSRWTARHPARWLAALLLAVALAASAAAFAQRDTGGTAPTGPPGDGCIPPAAGTHAVVVGTGHPPVHFHVPPGIASQRRPLVIVLPGAGMTGGGIAAYTGYSRLADREGFLVAYPTATGSRPFWDVAGTRPDDVAYLRAVITTLTGPVACADPDRVAMTGVSNGGGMTARMACDAADLLAAAAPVAGGYSTLPDCRPQRPLPILEIHGLRDTVVPYGGKGAQRAGAVDTFLAGWRGRDRCASRARRTAPARGVLELRWTCPDGREVVHDRIADAEHGWPGESSLRAGEDAFSTTAATWAFFAAHRRDVEPSR